MTWNYRVVKTVCAVLSVWRVRSHALGSLPRHEDGYTSYGIHEVFYAEGQRSAGTADDDGVPCVPMLGNPIDISADSEIEVLKKISLLSTPIRGASASLAFRFRYLRNNPKNKFLLFSIAPF